MTHTFQERIKWLLIAVAIPLLSSCWKAEEVFVTVDSVIDLKELPARDKLLYENAFDGSTSMDGWAMEGPGKIAFRNGWMEINAPDWKWYHRLSNPGHHVFWCPVDFPDSFIAEWEAQNLKTEAGLCIVFFAAKGKEGEDLFDSSLPERNGAFGGYTNGAINCYHISYYANATHNPDRQHANLRKNSGFHLAQTGHEGIATESEDIHRIQLIKDGSHIVLLVDDRKVIDWTDYGSAYGPVLESGKIGFRQMRWTHFRYRNFKVWSLGDKS